MILPFHWITPHYTLPILHKILNSCPQLFHFMLENLVNSTWTLVYLVCIAYIMHIYVTYTILWGFLGDSLIKNLPTNAGDSESVGLIPESGRSPWEENGNPNQYSCLESPMDRGAWQVTVHGVEKSWKWQQLPSQHLE